MSLRRLSRLHAPSRATWSNLAPALQALDQAGFRSIDPWGDLSFEQSLGTLHESPWERLSSLAEIITRTPLQMELRGRCLLGSRPYPESVVQAFVDQAVQCGVDAFLMYEPLNDPAGMEMIARAVNAAGARLTMGLVHSRGVSDPASYYPELAKLAAGLGASAVCLKTRESVGPNVLRGLVQLLAEVSQLPVEVLLDNAGGLGVAAAGACVAGGAGVVYGSAAPTWLDPSAVRFSALAPLLLDSGSKLEVAPAALAEIASTMGARLGCGEELSTDVPAGWEPVTTDWRELAAIPADLIWQILQRLRTVGAAERLSEVISEVVRVRGEVGDPALVPPIGQIVATQAVINVVYQKRWQLVPDEMKGFLRGEYGRPPADISIDLAHVVDGETERDDLQSSRSSPLESAEDALGQLALLPGDALLYIMAPDAAMVFLQQRQAALDVQRLDPKIPLEEEVIQIHEDWHDLGPEKVRELVALLEASSVDELTLEAGDTRVNLRKSSQPQPIAAPVPTPGQPSLELISVETEEPVTSDRHFHVAASMVGTFYRSPAPGVPPYVEVGSRIETGDPLCVLEAMKLMNELLSEVSGEVLSVLVEDGAAVEYGQPLFLVELDEV